MSLAPQEKIIILDFGSQYTQLIARRIRELNVFSEIVPCSFPLSELINQKPSGIILSGGPASVYQQNSPLYDQELFSMPVPILGICYGMQLMVHLLGGKVARSDHREYGRAPMTIQNNTDLFQSLPKTLSVWMSHGDQIKKLPHHFEPVAKTENSPYAGIRHTKRPIYGLQFHPEVAHTEQGLQIFQNFITLCGCQPTWNMDYVIAKAEQAIYEKIGSGKALAAVSGGVDSTVAAVLANRVLGKRLCCIFVDNGLLRKNEAAVVLKTFHENLNLKVRHIDASHQFINKLKSIKDPEKKRVRIGREFISVFEQVARKIKGSSFLVQGTLYPDVIESVSYKGPAAKIKTHHNVGGLPKKMNLSVVEPLRLLFKDEVRKLGAELKIPDILLKRHPFPGPGLAVRMLGPVTPERLNRLREADTIVEEEIRAAGLYDSLWQAFAVDLSIATVGVMGDERTYENVIGLRAVTSTDGMTADWAKIPHPVLEKISNRLTNEVKGVNRVVYDISSKPPATIEWE